MTAAGRILHVRGVVLPVGDEQDLYARDGRLVGVDELTAAERGSAETVAESGWVVPGLVDAHCHIGLNDHGAVDRDTQEAQAVEDRNAGALLVRDAGSAADTRWIDDREDLPKIIRAGRHIARSKRYIRNFGWEIEPDELVDYVDQEARRGDGWVKLVGDWIDRAEGDLTPCWPTEALIPAIARAHQLGARVTAHVFGSESLPGLLEAGIDCLEHGTGMTPDVIEVLAGRGVPVVPTMLQLEHFPNYAEQGEKRFPAYALRMRDLYARRHATFRGAVEAGVPLYAGTDAGGVLAHGLITSEIAHLAEVGLSAEQALAAGSWAARDWLGAPNQLRPGDPADLVVYPTDPRTDLRVLASPTAVMLRGRTY